MMKDYSAEEIIGFFSKKDSAFWEEEGRARAIALFHDAAVRVPAYKDFLAKNNIDHEKIKTWEEFQTVPLTNKKDYLKKYPLEQLCWDGNLNKQLVFTATSGSTGEPFYFPRTEKLDEQMAVIVESFLKNNGRNIQSPTLVVVGFGMGIWIGGLITYKAFEIAGKRGGYPISIITPGINKAEIFRTLKLLAPQFKQTILVGYPPFIKDVIDECPGQGIVLEKLNVRFVCAAEAFSEKFREYITKNAGVENMYADHLHIYGSADIGAMAWETPTSILIKRTTFGNDALLAGMFSGIKKSPTLAQYNSMDIMFEEVEGEVVLTGDNALPLIRYAIGDNGGVMTYADVIKKMKAAGIDIEEEAKKADVNELYQLPFVYVYERNDFSTTLYGAQIYPETIKEALLKDCLNRHVTGKFSMTTSFDEEQNQYLEINVELKKGGEAEGKEGEVCEGGEEDLLETVTKEITEFLKAQNAEFREISNQLKERAIPKIILWPAEHPTHFKPGTKQKWIQK